MNYHHLSLARTRDRAATEEVINTLRPRLVRMAAYYARCSHEDADDLLQEAWAGLLEALPALNLHIGNPEQYLIRYARWRLLDTLRRQKAYRQTMTRTDIAAEMPSQHQELSFSEVELVDFLKLLKPIQHSIVTFLIAGLTWREIGRILGCTSANVAYHVRQIKKVYEEWQTAVEGGE